MKVSLYIGNHIKAIKNICLCVFYSSFPFLFYTPKFTLSFGVDLFQEKIIKKINLVYYRIFLYIDKSIKDEDMNSKGIHHRSIILFMSGFEFDNKKK